MVNNSTNINKTNNHLSLSPLTQKNHPRHMTLEIRVMACDIYKNVAGSKLHRFASTQKDNILSQKNEKQYKHKHYNSSVNECSQLTDCKLGMQNMLVKDHYSQNKNIHRLLYRKAYLSIIRNKVSTRILPNIIENLRGCFCLLLRWCSDHQ